jgi:hypothetical protein
MLVRVPHAAAYPPPQTTVAAAAAAVGLEWRERRAGEPRQHSPSPTEHNRSCGGPILGTGTSTTAPLRRLGRSGCWGPRRRRSYPKGQTRRLAAHVRGG